MWAGGSQDLHGWTKENKYKPPDPRSWASHKQSEHKENHTQSLCNQNADNKVKKKSKKDPEEKRRIIYIQN